jgi:hypothetical protein
MTTESFTAAVEFAFIPTISAKLKLHDEERQLQRFWPIMKLAFFGDWHAFAMTRAEAPAKAQAAKLGVGWPLHEPAGENLRARPTRANSNTPLSAAKYSSIGRTSIG